jgi:hypothetical protein
LLLTSSGCFKSTIISLGELTIDAPPSLLLTDAALNLGIADNELNSASKTHPNDGLESGSKTHLSAQVSASRKHAAAAVKKRDMLRAEREEKTQVGTLAAQRTQRKQRKPKPQDDIDQGDKKRPVGAWVRRKPKPKAKEMESERNDGQKGSERFRKRA